MDESQLASITVPLPARMDPFCFQPSWKVLRFEKAAAFAVEPFSATRDFVVSVRFPDVSNRRFRFRLEPRASRFGPFAQNFQKRSP